mgnify:CR=1 FL=1
MNKNLLLIFILGITFLATTEAFSQRNNWAVGGRFGDPSGITVKKYMGRNALDMGVGQLLDDGLMIYAHYLWQQQIGQEPIDWYFGIGGQAGERADRGKLGADGVLGIEYTFKGAPISIFADGVLYMELIDDPLNEVDLDFGLGIRYNFR